MSTAASVTIPYQEFEMIQRARAEADQKIAALEAQIKSGEVKASDATLLAIARAGIEVARYAVASLPAESNKDWPGAALRTIAANLPTMPGASIDEMSLASTFEYFADEIDLYEKRRQGIAKNMNVGSRLPPTTTIDQLAKDLQTNDH